MRRMRRAELTAGKSEYVVEDSQYQVPRAVQAINKLLNNDKVFMTLQGGGT